MKHITDDSLTWSNASNQFITLVKGALNPDPYTNANNVRAGSIVRHIEIMIDYGTDTSSDATGLHQYDWYVWYNVNQAQVQPIPNSVNVSHLKNQVFQQGSGQFGLAKTASATVIPPAHHVIRLSINIPKWAQQINDGDAIELVFAQNNSTNNWTAKVKSIYKEIFP